MPEPSRDIFALGVVALWLFGRIPLPETLKEYRFKIRALDIADGPDMRARGAWLDFLGRSARTLDDRDPYQRLTRQMLALAEADVADDAAVRAEARLRDDEAPVGDTQPRA